MGFLKGREEEEQQATGGEWCSAVPGDLLLLPGDILYNLCLVVGLVRGWGWLAGLSWWWCWLAGVGGGDSSGGAGGMRLMIVVVMVSLGYC